LETLNNNEIATIKGIAHKKVTTVSRPNLMAAEASLESPSAAAADRHRVPLPLELNCEIFEFLKMPRQKKFIWRLGRGIYGMFRHKLLTKVGD
jgi:hypothetical protein